MVAAAAIAAVPLAEAGVKYAADMAKSMVAQITDALRTPLLSAKTTSTKETRRGHVETVYSAALPAWAVVAGGIVALLAFGPQIRSGVGIPEAPAAAVRPWWWPPLLPWP